MHRRGFLTTAGLAAAGLSMAGPARGQTNPSLTKPKALRPGDKVAIVNPSTSVHDPAVIDRARSLVEALGLTPVFPAGLLQRPRDFKASVQHRLNELHEAFADRQIRGIFCARGGYGVSEIVQDIDYRLIRRNPKVFVGFSDLTLLHLAIQKNARLVTFHGRMASQARFPDYSLQALKRAILSTDPLGPLRNPEESSLMRPAYPLRTLVPGIASGRLVGGNLTMLAAALGTPWDLDTRGAIFFVEDVDEPPYSIARMLFSLKHAGKFRDAAGVVVGACLRCDGSPEASPYSLNEVFDIVLGDLKVPVFSGLAIGHTDEQLTLPLGVMARVDASRGELAVLEAGVVA